MRGRKPKTAFERTLGGNAGKRPIQEEPVYTAGAPRMPAWLRPAAKRVWKATIPELVKAGTITRVDVAVLAAYCQSFAAWVHCEDRLWKTGGPTLIKTEGKKKSTYQNPAVFNVHKYRDATMKLAEKIGLTPTDRARVKLAGVDTPGANDDPFVQHEKKFKVHEGGRA